MLLLAFLALTLLLPCFCLGIFGGATKINHPLTIEFLGKGPQEEVEQPVAREPGIIEVGIFLRCLFQALYHLVHILHAVCKEIREHGGRVRLELARKLVLVLCDKGFYIIRLNLALFKCLADDVAKGVLHILNILLETSELSGILNEFKLVKRSTNNILYRVSYLPVLQLLPLTLCPGLNRVFDIEKKAVVFKPLDHSFLLGIGHFIIGHRSTTKVPLQPVILGKKEVVVGAASRGKTMRRQHLLSVIKRIGIPLHYRIVFVNKLVKLLHDVAGIVNLVPGLLAKRI